MGKSSSMLETLPEMLFRRDNVREAPDGTARRKPEGWPR